MSRIILHIDMDAFFAAIEELDHPEYRGKPVVVGADPKGGKGRGVVSTCNYEARKYGIHSAMPISQAYKRCPFAIYAFPRGSRYGEISQNLFTILSEFTPKVEPISVDEAFMDITGCIRLLGSPEEIAKKIKQRITDELQLSASIGIAPIKFVAKIASDLKKPDGLVIVEPGQVTEFLHPLPISRMWGVGKKTEVQLKVLGINTIGDLAKLSQDAVIKKFGKSGLHFWTLANGIDEREVEYDHSIKSVSLENTFEEDASDEEIIEQTINAIADNLSRILRKKQVKGKTVTLKIRLHDFSTFTRSHSFGSYFNSSQLISAIALNLYHDFQKHGKKVRLLGIAVSNLNTQCDEQLGFFDTDTKADQKIDHVIDLVQNKFGPDLIKKASLLGIHSRRVGKTDDEE